MKHKKLYIIAFAATTIITVVIIISIHGIQTADGYQDAGGWIYTCSRPIRVKYQDPLYFLKTRKHPEPVDQSEANKYCHSIGIE